MPVRIGELELLQINSSFTVRTSGSVESGGSGKLEIEIEHAPLTTLNITYAGKEYFIQMTLLGSQPESYRQWLSNDTPALYVQANGSYITMKAKTNASGWPNPSNLKWTGEWVSSPVEENNYTLNWERIRNITIFHKGSPFTHDVIRANLTFSYDIYFIIGLAERNKAPIFWYPIWMGPVSGSSSVIMNIDTIPFSFILISAVSFIKYREENIFHHSYNLKINQLVDLSKILLVILPGYLISINDKFF
jgi:hypothetical protein